MPVLSFFSVSSVNHVFGCVNENRQNQAFRFCKNGRKRASSPPYAPILSVSVIAIFHQVEFCKKGKSFHKTVHPTERKKGSRIH